MTAHQPDEARNSRPPTAARSPRPAPSPAVTVIGRTPFRTAVVIVGGRVLEVNRTDADRAMSESTTLGISTIRSVVLDATEAAAVRRAFDEEVPALIDPPRGGPC